MISLLTLLFLCIGGSYKQKNKTDSPDITVIKGKIEFSPGDTVDLYAYPDVFQKYLNKKTIVASSAADSRGRFSFSFHFDQPSAFDLKLGNQILASNLFICPGEKLIINFTDSISSPRAHFDDDGARNNQFLFLFNEMFFKEPKTKRYYYINSNFLTAEEYSEFLKKRRRQEKKLYDDFFAASPPRKEFETYLHSEIEYQYAIDKLMYLWKKGIKNKEAHAGKDYFDFTSKEFIENPSALNSPSYVHFLNLYFNNLFEQQLFKIRQTQKPNLEELALEKILFAKKKFSGLSLQIITLNILNEEANSTNY